MRLTSHNYILWQNIWGTFQHIHEMQPFTETELMLQLWSELLVRGWFTSVCSPTVCPANPPDRTAFISPLQEDDFYRISSSAARTHSRAQVFLSVKGVQRGCCSGGEPIHLEKAGKKKKNDEEPVVWVHFIYYMLAYSLSICGWKRVLSSALLAFRVGVSRPFSMVNCSGWR